MYFQWRKSRGAFEKMHGAVVDHEGTDRTRVFQDVAAHGADLRKLDAVVGTTVRPEVAIVNDWEIALGARPHPGAAAGPGRLGRPVRQGVHPDPHRPLPAVLEARHQRGRDREPLGLRRATSCVVAPMLFMLKPGVAERLAAFVKGGGTLVLTYLSGIVERDEPRLPGRLAGRRPARGGRDLGRGDRLAAARTRRSASSPRPATRSGSPASTPCASTASACTPRGRRSSPPFKNDFYAGMPALTVNRHGAGRVYYLAARPAGRRVPRRRRARPRARAGARAQPRRRPARGRDRPEARGRGQDVPLPPQLRADGAGPRPRRDAPRGRGRRRPDRKGDARRVRLAGRRPGADGALARGRRPAAEAPDRSGRSCASPPPPAAGTAGTPPARPCRSSRSRRVPCGRARAQEGQGTGTGSRRMKYRMIADRVRDEDREQRPHHVVHPAPPRVAEDVADEQHVDPDGTRRRRASGEEDRQQHETAVPSRAPRTRAAGRSRPVSARDDEAHEGRRPACPVGTSAHSCWKRLMRSSLPPARVDRAAPRPRPPTATPPAT